MTTAKRLSENLDRLLSLEYAALLRGDLVEIEKNGTEKVQVLQSIETLDPPEIEAFEHLRERLIRNQLLTQSAISGMRKAILRTKEIDDVTAVLRTYGSDGQKSGLRMRSGQALSKRS